MMDEANATRTVVVANAEGFHLRPATLFVVLALAFVLVLVLVLVLARPFARVRDV